MKCSKCGREITEEQTYAYQGKPFCDDCLMEVGLHSRECEPWGTYLATRERTGKEGMEGFTQLQQKVYGFIKSKNKVTRDEVKKELKLSEEDLDAQLTPLMHSEMVKEQGSQGSEYLVAVR